MSSSGAAMPTSASMAGPSNSDTKKIVIAGVALTQLQLGIIAALLVGGYAYHYKKGPFAPH